MYFKPFSHATMLSLVNTFVQFKSLCRINLFILSIVQNSVLKLEHSYFSDMHVWSKKIEHSSFWRYSKLHVLSPPLLVPISEADTLCITGSGI